MEQRLDQTKPLIGLDFGKKSINRRELRIFELGSREIRRRLKDEDDVSSSTPNALFIGLGIKPPRIPS